MRKVLCLLLPVLLSSAAVFSQELNGRVLSEGGRNASNVTVRFQHKDNAISTNADGTFRIMATRLPDTLVFSAAGFEPYKVVITEKNIRDPNFEVVLLNSRKTMDEVVVTAVGTKRQAKELSYSASTVTNPAHAISGKVPGVKIESGSTIKIRGYASGAGSYSADQVKLYFRDTNIGPRQGMLAKSRILTAGEINDFNKWKMWEDYSANDFKIYSSFWGMRSDNRFSIQVADKNHNAVINEPLFLVHKSSKDTAWRTFTDNTGKAELWAGFFRDSTAAISKSIHTDYFISDSKGNTVYNLAAFANGVNQLSVDKTCFVSNEVDIAFVVDATGSMGDEIEFLKLELEDVLRNTIEKYSSLSIRTSSVFYRDKRDEYLTRSTPFNEDMLKTLNFVKLQSAGGGGDYPEAVDDALAVALDSLQWNKHARTRLLFLVLDAPPHGSARERMQQLVAKAAAMGIRIIPIACSGTDKSTEFLLRSMALATNGTYTFLTNHSGVGFSHIEPTTDKYQVEVLNNLLQRLIAQSLYAKDCSGNEIQQPDTKQPENVLSVKLYPNPTHGLFTIESKADIKEIYIADFTGKILMRLAAADKKGRWYVDIGRYPSATYLVKYVTMDNKWGVEKVVLVR